MLARQFLTALIGVILNGTRPAIHRGWSQFSICFRGPSPHNRDNAMSSIIQRGAMAVSISVTLMLLLTPYSAAQNPNEVRKADVLEKMARAEFGQLSAAELKLMHAAPGRETQWIGPSQIQPIPATIPCRGPDGAPIERSALTYSHGW